MSIVCVCFVCLYIFHVVVSYGIVCIFKSNLLPVWKATILDHKPKYNVMCWVTGHSRGDACSAALEINCDVIWLSLVNDMDDKFHFVAHV